MYVKDGRPIWCSLAALVTSIMQDWCKEWEQKNGAKRLERKHLFVFSLYKKGCDKNGNTVLWIQVGYLLWNRTNIDVNVMTISSSDIPFLLYQLNHQISVTLKKWISESLLQIPRIPMAMICLQYWLFSSSYPMCFDGIV